MASSAATSRCRPSQWSITGEVVLIGEPPAPVLLAGFYTSCHDFFYASQPRPACGPAQLVTDVVRVTGECTPFTLCFDVDPIDPARGHYIYLILWADVNRNGLYDPGEEWKYVIPLFDDRVFGGATDCVYYFDERDDGSRGTSAGWNQSAGLERYVPVGLACHEGARLANDAPWSGRPT
ncbi:MAG TPA: hypothetical protein VHE79_15490 [Spirochaetia bacterium]